jgi:hypothetical protein
MSSRIYFKTRVDSCLLTTAKANHLLLPDLGFMISQIHMCVMYQATL